MLKKNPSINCTGCGACAAVCPKGCIKLVPNEEGFLYPLIDEEACVHCNRCEGVCPSLCKNEKVVREVRAYAVTNNDKTQQRESSSGEQIERY